MNEIISEENVVPGRDGNMAKLPKEMTVLWNRSRLEHQAKTHLPTSSY